MSGALVVVAPGLADSLQDLGRRGLARFGVPPAGALDAEALALANALVGAEPGRAALEMRFLGPTLRVEAESVRLAVAGAAVEMRVTTADGGEATAPGWRSTTLRRGDRVAVGPLRGASTAYLAVAGGFAAPAVYGSAAAYPRAGLGGFDGAGGGGGAGARLALVAASAPEGPERAAPAPDWGPPARARVVFGPQEARFTADARALFLATDWRVSQSADRMGLRLEGPRLAHEGGADITSDGVVSGAIQVPASGQPILLLADRQTAGGYAKIAAVITADLPAMGRLAPGDPLRFAEVSLAEAREALAAADAAQARRLAAVAPLGGLDQAALYDANLISGVTAGGEG
ncbi:MAG: biotin-dependent carboxyltransferase family protein [Pseudomonadota bacterium]